MERGGGGKRNTPHHSGAGGEHGAGLKKDNPGTGDYGWNGKNTPGHSFLKDLLERGEYINLPDFRFLPFF